MDARHFDAFTQRVSASQGAHPTRRRLVGALVSGLGLAVLRRDTLAGRRRKKRRDGKRGKGGKGGGGGLPLGSICNPGEDTCAGNLRCDSPTTRHTCSSTVDGIDTWCCVPPGGRCTECDCCGDFSCAFDDENQPSCQPNPEG